MDDISSIKHVITSINWFSEPILTTILITFYFSCILTTYITWKRLNIQTVYFTILCAGIYFAETLNIYCAKNWKFFSTKNQFFDSKGLFISVVYSIPIVINLLVIVLHWMRSASSDLISLKRRQLQDHIKKETKKNE